MTTTPAPAQLKSIKAGQHVLHGDVLGISAICEVTKAPCKTGEREGFIGDWLIGLIRVSGLTKGQPGTYLLWQVVAIGTLEELRAYIAEQKEQRT